MVEGGEVVQDFHRERADLGGGMWRVCEVEHVVTVEAWDS